MPNGGNVLSVIVNGRTIFPQTVFYAHKVVCFIIPVVNRSISINAFVFLQSVVLLWVVNVIVGAKGGIIVINA